MIQPWATIGGGAIAASALVAASLATIRAIFSRALKRSKETILERDHALAELGRTTALLEAIVNMTPDLVFAKDLHSKAIFRNRAALFGKSWDQVEGRQETEWHQSKEEAEQVVANDQAVIQSGKAMQFVEPFTTLHGKRTLLSTKSPWFDEHGQIIGTIGVSTDITERENRAKHVELIMNELSHRSKNLLVIIQSVARQSVRQSSGLEDFENQFNGRLASLARLHDLLVEEEWRGASVRAIAQTQIGPFAGNRMEIEGPEVLLRPEIAQVISMVFYELATNASKYGALSDGAGAVVVTWGFSDEGTKTFFIRWKESGGPAVMPPQRKGFGTVVLERMALQIRGASATLDFPTQGVVWSFEVPAESLKDRRTAFSSINEGSYNVSCW